MILIEEAPLSDAAMPLEAFKQHLRMGSGFGVESVQDAMLASFLRAAMVAANRVDLLATMRWGYEWDIAAATLIAREAGAAVSDIFGQPLGYNKRDPRSFGLLVCAPRLRQAAIEHFGPRAREMLGTAKGPR